jgi:two-component system, cell cycle sensor histidine kinase PleC
MAAPANDVWSEPRASLDGSPAPPALVIDAAAGAIVAANAAGWELWGFGDDAAVPTTALDRAMPALQRLAATTSSCSEVLTFWTRRGLLQLECRIEPAGGTRFLLRGLEARPEAPDDTTAMALARPVARLPASARVAHELRTPLSAVIAYAEVLKDEHFGPLANPRYREYARTIYDSARHALSVVDGMLAGNLGRAGLPELAFRDLDPADVIENCLAVAGPLAQRAGLDLVADLDAAMPRIVADEVSVKQMLLNLITNAIKFGRRGDRVTVRAVRGSDGSLTIDVADTGPGMRAPVAVEAERAAEARRKGGGREAGLGIGLPLTRALAKANGASLTVESAPGRGTRVSIAFAKDRVVPV